MTGAPGQLGRDVVSELLARGHEVIASGRAPGIDLGAPYVPLDITDEGAVQAALSEARADAVIHCAAWTAVDAAEEAANRDEVMRVNGDGTRNIAEACARFGCKLMAVSTDYVFSGEGEAPWQPDERVFRPLNVYGQSKLAGERAICETLGRFFIVRTQWLYGLNGTNFVRTMLRLGETHDELRVVNDQIGRPTYSPDLARLLVDMAQTQAYGVYHATNEGEYISWADFAREILQRVGLHTRVVPVTTAEYGASKAIRPLNGRLATDKLARRGFSPLPSWRDALARHLSLLGRA